MDFSKLVNHTRSIRRFKQDKKLSEAFLRHLIDVARLAPSGGNIQPLKYAFSVDSELNSKIFKTLSWAGYLPDWNGPEQGEQPAAYVVICLDQTLKKETIDHGFAAQNILLAAAEKNVGACVIKSIRKKQLGSLLTLDRQYEILLVIALGYAAETVQLEKVKNNDIRYWRDNQNIFHVPKRSLEELIIKRQ